jgi:ribosomal protein S18 acetylase RimI-like enzyme
MTIRNALQSDVDSMARLLLIVHHMHVVADPQTYRAISHKVAVDCLLQKLEQNAFLRVAEFESTLHGYCSAVIRKSLETPGFEPREFIYVEEIVVRPESRKGGIGGALIDDVKSFARQEGILEIELDVGHFNREAKAFFQSQGFRTLRQRMNTRLDT